MQPYQPGERAMIKVKHARTADCVVAGFRWHKQGPGTLLGSLLLGLYDDEGKLHHVGIAASFTMKRRKELVEELAPLRENALRRPPVARVGGFAARRRAAGQRMPGATSRWNRGKDLSWEPLRIERVCEVGYDHLQGDRFRHATHFVRWRPDKPPADCRYDQLEERPAAELAKLFGSGAMRLACRPEKAASTASTGRGYETVDARALSLVPAASSFRRVTCRRAITTRSSNATRLGLAMTSSPGTSDSTSTASSRSRHAVSSDARARVSFPGPTSSTTLISSRARSDLRLCLRPPGSKPLRLHRNKHARDKHHGNDAHQVLIADRGNVDYSEV